MLIGKLFDRARRRQEVVVWFGELLRRPWQALKIPILNSLQHTAALLVDDVARVRAPLHFFDESVLQVCEFFLCRCGCDGGVFTATN